MPAEVSGLTAKKGKSEILEELIHSAQKTNVLGLFIEGEEEMITTSVVQISETENNIKLIYLQPCDLHGYPIDRNPVLLTDIKSVIQFKTLFNDPVYVRIRKRREGRSDNRAA